MSWRVQVVINEEYKPSRRSIAPRADRGRASYSAKTLALYLAENCRRPEERSGTSGSGGAVSSIAPAWWRVRSRWLIVVVMGEVPSPPSQFIDLSRQTVSLKVDTEGEAWVVKRAARCDQDPLGPRVLAMAKAGTPIAVMAERLCISPRQLHRRCLPAFGYGPRHLSRIMRFQRALEEIRCGVPLAQVAAGSGYADQAHLSREVRVLAGTTPRGLLGDPYADGSGANRSTGRPSGSWTTA